MWWRWVLTLLIGALVSVLAVATCTTISYIEYAQDLIHDEIILVKSLMNQAYQPEEGIEKAISSVTGLLYGIEERDAYSEMILSRLDIHDNAVTLIFSSQADRIREVTPPSAAHLQPGQGMTTFSLNRADFADIDVSEAFGFAGARFLMTNRINLIGIMVHYTSASAFIIIAGIGLVLLALFSVSTPFRRDMTYNQKKLVEILEGIGAQVSMVDVKTGAILGGTERRGREQEDAPAPERSVIYDKRSGRTYEVVTTDIRWIDGRAARVECKIDITKWQQIDNERMQMSAVVDNLTDYVSISAPDLSCMYLNESGLKLTGYSREDRLEPSMLHDERSIHILRYDAMPVLKSGQSRHWKGETRIRKKDGTLVNVHQDIIRLDDQSGELIGFATMIHDLSERYRLEHELMVRMALLNSNKDFVAALDKNLKCIYINPGALSMVGLPLDTKAADVDILKLFDKSGSALLRVNAQRVLVGEQCTWQGEVRLRPEGRGEVLATEMLFPLAGDNEEIIGIGLQLCDITEQKRVQTDAAIQSTVARFSQDFVLVCDEHLNTVFTNDGAYQMIGLDRVETGGQLLPEMIFDAQTAALVRQGMRTVLRTGSWTASDLQMIRADGQRLDIELRGFRIRAGLDLQNGMGVIIHDISPLKQLQRDMQLQSQIAQWATNFIMVLDSDQKVIYMNEAAYMMGGYPIGSDSGKAALVREMIFEHDDPTALRPEVRLAMVTGHWSGESMLRRSDGRNVAVTQNFYTIRDERGNNTALVLMMTDISDNKRVQMELKRTQKRLETALNVAKASVWEIDMARGKVRLDGNAAQLVGGDFEEGEYSIEDFTKRFIAVTGPDGADYLKGLTRRQITDSNISRDLKITRADGSVIYINNFGMSTMDSRGRTRSTIGLMIDVTHRIQMQQQLTLAKEQAEAASKAKSQFLSSVSHEIRTPMNAILGMTRIAKASTEMDHIHTALGKVEASSIHLLSILNDVLDLAKIESGHFELAPEAFSLERTIQTTIDVVAVRAEEKQLQLTVSVDREIPSTLVGDPMRLSQVVLNLMGNAVKFTPAGGQIWLNVDGTGYGQPGKDGRRPYGIQLVVRDTGIGLSEEQMGRLFQMFEQADNSITKKYGGTGLGLAISKRIAGMMRGDIYVQSELGEGAAFTFDLVLDEATPEEAKEIEVPVLSERAKEQRVLVLDERPEVGAALVNMLRKDGIRAEMLKGLNELVGRADEDGWDLALVDDGLCGDGLEKLGEIRAQMKGLPVILMTPQFTPPDLEQIAKGLEIRQFVSKPVLRGALTVALNRFVGDLAPEEQGKKQQRYTKQTILLAEDIEINQEILCALLEPTGVQIVIANDGGQAVEKFEKEPDRFDLVFMDIQMPHMDGYEAVRRIRALEVDALVKVPIVAMTANAFTDDIQRAKDCGMNGHIAKPVDEAQVFEALEQYLKPDEVVEEETENKGGVSERSEGIGDKEVTLDVGNCTENLTVDLRNDDIMVGIETQSVEGYGSMNLNVDLNQIPEGTALTEMIEQDLAETEPAVSTFALVDQPAGLKMLGGNQKIYNRLLGTYKNGDLYDKVIAAVQSGDVEQTKVACHTLKGAAGNLHLEAVFEQAKEAEAEIKAGGLMPTYPAILKLASLQKQTIKEIEGILG